MNDFRVPSLSFVRRYAKCASMQFDSDVPTRTADRPALHRSLLVVGLLSLALLGEMVGCGGGGGGSTAPTGPLQAAPRWRRDDLNTGRAISAVGFNAGMVALHYDFALADVTPLHSTPAIGRNRTMYIGLSEGLVSLNADGEERWFLDECAPADTATAAVPMRFLSSPTIAPNGRDIIVGSDDPTADGGGAIFWLRESLEGDEPPECMFAFATGSRSAALTSVDGADLRLLSIVIGTVSGRLISLNTSGLRRWSFPEQAPFSGSVSSSPAAVVGGVVFTAPDGQLHSIDPSGRARWSVPIGGPYDGFDLIPSPVSFDNIFTVSAEGDIVAFSSTGGRLWTFQTDAEIAGSLIASSVPTSGGLFLDENAVFALDQQGTLYAIGASRGGLLRFCATENRACLPSTCPGEEPCDSRMRCSETTDMDCADADCPAGESCIEEFRCSNDPTLECTRDLCVSNAAAGLCTREAKHSMTDVPATFVTSPIFSTDGFIVAGTTDGRICARQLDGSVPAGTCPSGARCTPDSCVAPDRCCPLDDTECMPGRCRAQPERSCTLNTCENDEECTSVWSDGCITLDPTDAAAASTTISSPVVDDLGRIFVTTEKGVARVQ